MTDTLTKADLLKRTKEARAAYEALFSAIPHDQLSKPNAVGYWSAKDLQAHLNTDHRWITGQLQALVRGEQPTTAECYGHDQAPPPGTNLANQDERNAWWHSIDQHRSLDEVLAQVAPRADALEAIIMALPEEELAQQYTYGNLGHVAHVRPATENEPAWTLSSIVASYAHEHYATHTADLQASWQRGFFDTPA